MVDNTMSRDYLSVCALKRGELSLVSKEFSVELSCLFPPSSVVR